MAVRGSVMQWLAAGASACVLVLPLPAFAEIPPAVEAMIREAVRSGDRSAAAAVTKVAKATNPNQAGEIDALSRSLLAEADATAKKAREEKLAQQSYLGGWSGEGQVGFGVTSGNTEEVSGIISVSLKKETLQTRHKMDALVDFLRTNGVTTRRRYAASYGLDYLFDVNFYAYGIAGWEQDQFAGYARRFTESFGVGLRAIDRPNMTLDLDAGPAFRQTLFTDGAASNDIGPRASLTYKWTLRPGAVFTQNASIVSDDNGTTIISNTAMTSKITGGLSARLSVKVQTESNRTADTKPTDTATRATLVYTF